MSRAFRLRHLLIIVLCCQLSGCFGGPDRPATYPVRGRITFKGKPVAGATVTFLTAGAPRLAMGSTDESGNFILTTYDENDGAMPGTHVVTVKKIADESSAPGTAGPPAADSSAVAQSIERAMQETALKARAAEKARSLLPAKYAHHDTSDLRLEVVEGPNHFEIELKD